MYVYELLGTLYCKLGFLGEISIMGFIHLLIWRWKILDLSFISLSKALCEDFGFVKSFY